MARSLLRKTVQTRLSIAQVAHLERLAKKLDPASPSVSAANREIIERDRLAQLERDKLSQQDSSSMGRKARAA